MNSAVEFIQALLQLLFILLPCLTIDSRRSFPLQTLKAFPKQIDRQVVQQCVKANLLIFSCRSSHTLQSRQHGWLARRRSRVGLHVFSLVQPLPSSDSSAFTLFAAFSGTTSRSDSSITCASAWGFFSFSDRSDSFQMWWRSPGSQQKVFQRARGL